MNKKTLIFILFAISLFSAFIFAQRGFKAIRTPEGKEIALYKGSYALIVGNSKYTSGWDPLTAAERDVEELGDVLRRNGFEATVLKNITKSGFLSALSNFTYKHGQDEDNQLLFYYAGHGHTTTLASGEELGMLVMVDAPLPEKDPQGFDSKSVDMKSIITWALKMKSKHVLFMFDSCFSGTVLNLRDRVMPKAISNAVRYPVRQFITAGRADEAVPDRSVFKQLLIDILEGKVEEPIKDGYITGEELGLFLKNKVPEYNKFQHPQYGKIRDPNLDKGDFVFVLEKGGLGLQEEILAPPKAEKLDLSSIEESAKRREEARRKWNNWQEQMESDFKKVKSIDQNPKNTAKEKKSAWEKFLRNYNADNPFSAEDEDLRQRATQRIKELTEPKVKVQKRVSPRSSARGKDPEYQYNLSLVHLRNGDFNEAIRILNKAIALKPNYNHALYTLGLVYSMKGEFQEAINYLKKCLDIDPSMTDARNSLGVAYQELGFLEEAEKEFKIATLDTNYKSIELPYYNLARIYLMRGNLQEALGHIDRALLFNTDFRMANNLKGMILERQLKYAEAIEYYKKALKNLQADQSLGPDLAAKYWVTINFNLGVAYFKNNELQKAKDVFVSIYPRVKDPDMKTKIDQYLRVIK